jgi:Uncharacterized protein conserved in bacteria (DUF2188)
MTRKNQYIIRHPEGWAVKGEGNSRATRVFDRQSEAIEFGIEVVKNQRSILIIFNRQGVERDRKDYRNYQPPSYYYSPTYNWSYNLQPIYVPAVEPAVSTLQNTEQEPLQEAAQEALVEPETLTIEASPLTSLQSELN